MSYKIDDVSLPLRSKIKRYGNYALDAYQDRIDGFLNISDIDSGTEVFFRVDRKYKEVVFAHRGTDCDDEWIDVNFKFILDLMQKSINPYENVNPHVLIHPGMMKKYMYVRKNIHNVARHYARLGYHFVFCGHSQGAVVAEYAALDCQYNFNANVSIYKFGSSMSGSLAYKRSIEGRIIDIFNIQTYMDPVCFLPSVFFGYHHTGMIIKVGKGSFFPFGSNHNIPRYRHALEKIDLY